MCGAVLCFIGCLATSLASTRRETPVAFQSPVVITKTVSRHWQLSPWVQDPPLVENHCTEGMGMVMAEERKKKLGNIGGCRGGLAWMRLLEAGVSVIPSDLWSSCVSASESPSLFWGERQVHPGKQEGPEDKGHMYEVEPCAYMEPVCPVPPA